MFEENKVLLQQLYYYYLADRKSDQFDDPLENKSNLFEEILELGQQKEEKVKK